MIRILIVEDDAHIAKMITTTLELAGYQSEICTDGLSAIDAIENDIFDLVLLDIMLPKLDGFGVMERIQNKNIPVIFLTALQDVCDKVKGLRMGAEDYIVKPFEAMELLARIEVVLRRYQKGESVLNYGPIEVNVLKHTVQYESKDIALTPKEFDTLLFFLQHQDTAITRERLLSAIWGYDFVGESRTVDIHVQQVRRKLHLQNKLITIPKLGYRLESEG